MEQKKNRGGQREGSGRKPLGLDKKTAITVYIPKKQIIPFGSADKLKGSIYEFVSSFGQTEVAAHDLTQPTNEIKPQEQPKSNYFVDTTPKPVARRKTVQEWISEKRSLETHEQYQEWFNALTSDPYLTSKEKSAIKQA